MLNDIIIHHEGPDILLWIGGGTRTGQAWLDYHYELDLDTMTEQELEHLICFAILCGLHVRETRYEDLPTCRNCVRR